MENIDNHRKNIEKTFQAYFAHPYHSYVTKTCLHVALDWYLLNFCVNKILIFQKDLYPLRK